ncbi:TM216 protein, partial [Amia calva]|nr:TM216 protein [Amia calva]
LSSTPLEVLLFLNSWYFTAFFIAEILMFIYKGVLLPYPPSNLALELLLLLLFLGVETLRLFYGSKGNLCQRRVCVCVSVCLWLPCAVLCLYFLLLQTFILRLELLLTAGLLVLYCPELLLELTTLTTLTRY